MRTKRIKASNVRIGDDVYGFGIVETIAHLSREAVDFYFANGEILTAYFDGALVEMVVPGTNANATRHTLCKTCGKSLGWNGHAYSDCK